MKKKAEPRTSGRLFDLMRSQEYGGRRECMGLILSGKVEWGRPASCGKIEWQEAGDPWMELETRDLWLRVDGEELPWLDKVYIAFHKPGNVECSHNPASHISVFDFFPGAYLARGVQPVGRLDADTTGLLLLTDDGVFNHDVISPRRKQPKTYRVGVKHPLTPEQVAALENGVVLRDDPAPTLPAVVRPLGEREADIVITEGRYHQIKRMVAAVGNRVESIHRSAIGPLDLGTLPEGEWRYLTDEEVARFRN
ncbi:MAG: rsuA [Fibrobacteria bacterium]|jgi:16S rRNA pseudouridine516 synthase|nr:rsuA [Fibrobacteria bacterium]